MQRSSNAKWRSSKTRIFFLLCLSPFLLIALFIWWALGRLLTLSSWIVGATFITLSWVLYFLQLPSQALLLVDLPITITVIMLAWIFLLPQHLLHVTRNTGYKFLIRASVWMVLLAYSLARRWTVANPSDQTVAILNVYVFLTSIFPLWHLITDLRLWVPANEIDLEIAERNIYEQHIQSEYRVKTVAGLGTVHVPYCGDDNSNPSCLVLLHGYLAGNAFWAAVRLQECMHSIAYVWSIFSGRVSKNWLSLMIWCGVQGFILWRTDLTCVWCSMQSNGRVLDALYVLGTAQKM